MARATTTERFGAAPGGRARAAALLAAAALALACGSRAPAAPRPTSITPDRGAAGVAVSVRIAGEGFGPPVSADFVHGGGDVIDARYQAFLGAVPLDDVALRQDGSLAATVPADLALGTHDLTVVDPAGRTGTLPGAYRALASPDAAAVVARLRVEPVAAQVAYAPFTVVVTALDAAGAVVADFTGEVQLSDATGTAVPSSIGLFSGGRWTGAVEVRAPRAGDVLTVTLPGGATGASAPFDVAPAPAAAVRFVTPALQLQAGACAGPVTVSLRDAFDLETTAAAPVTAAVAATSAGVALFADAACQVPAGGAVVAAGQGAASFWLVATAAGPLQLSASAPSLSADSLTASVGAGPPAALAFVTAPQTVAAGACSGIATVRLLDAYGNPVAPSTAATAIAVAGPGLTLFADAACAGGAVSSVAVPAGATTASLYFRGAAAGAAPVTASAAGLAPASQTETIVAAAATRLAFATAPQTVAAGACSGVATVQARDAWANPSAPSATAATPVALAAPGLTLYTDGACATAPVTAVSVPATGTSASFYFRGTTAGPATVTASATGLGAASQTETLVAAAATQLTFTTTPQTITAGACSGVATVQARDAWGNPTPVSAALPVTVALASGALAFFTDAACATAPVTSVTLAAAASSTSFYARGTVAGPATVTATAAGLTSAAQSETVVAAAATQLAFTSAAQTVTAGSCSGVVTLEARDAWGNPGAVSPPAPTSISVAGLGVAVHAGAGCGGAAVTSVTLAAGATSTTLSFVGTTAGAAAVSATATGLAGASQGETVVAGAATQLAFATPAQSVTAGSCSGAVTVETLDAWGNPAAISSTATSTVALSAPGLTLHAGTGCAGGAVASVDLAAGTTAATFSFAGTTAGTSTIGASAAGLSAASQVETITAGPTDHYVWSTVATPQSAGVAFAATITAVDLYGNRKNYSGTVTLSASSGTVSCATACTSAGETASFSNGQWTGTLVVPAAATGLTLTATGSGRTGTSNAFDVLVPAGRSPPVARFTASARVITSGNSITFDASGSTDGQTPASALAVSWHFEALDADLASTTAPDASPWTVWTTTKTATHAFLNNTGVPIIYRPRLAVRDTEAGPGGPDVGYATGTIVVLPSASNVCVVDTDSLVDDNNWANTCDVKGIDGRTSLAEAVRVANGSAVPMNIVFSGTRNIVGGGQTFWMNTPVRILADPGAVVLDGVSLALNATGILVSGLEFARLTAPITVADASEVRLEDLYVHDGAGIEVRGQARVVRTRMSGCSGVACVYTNSWGAYLALFSSDLQGPGTGVGVSVDTCASATPGVMGTGSSPYLSFLNGWSDTGSAFIAASVLSGFSVAVSGGTAITCPHPVVANVTFDRNGTGVRRGDAGGYVRDSIFTNHTAAAIDPAVCAFDQLARNLSWGNASDGCLASSTGLLAADPLFVDAAARDYRLQYASPAKDAGIANGTEVDDAAPGLYLGAAPDRGGRETW